MASERHISSTREQKDGTWAAQQRSSRGSIRRDVTTPTAHHNTGVDDEEGAGGRPRARQGGAGRRRRWAGVEEVLYARWATHGTTSRRTAGPRGAAPTAASRSTVSMVSKAAATVAGAFRRALAGHGGEQDPCTKSPGQKQRSVACQESKNVTAVTPPLLLRTLRAWCSCWTKSRGPWCRGDQPGAARRARVGQTGPMRRARSESTRSGA